MACRAEVMKNRGVENFYRLSGLDPAQARRRRAYELPGGLRTHRSQGFLEIAGVVSSCQGPQGWALPLRTLIFCLDEGVPTLSEKFSED